MISSAFLEQLKFHSNRRTDVSFLSRQSVIEIYKTTIFSVWIKEKENGLSSFTRIRYETYEMFNDYSRMLLRQQSYN